jgi:WD40 repeat protein
MWDVKGGGAVATLHGHKGGVTAAAWNDNGNWLLTAARDATLKVPLCLRPALAGQVVGKQIAFSCVDCCTMPPPPSLPE